jgi:hypothetical protein
MSRPKPSPSTHRSPPVPAELPVNATVSLAQRTRGMAFAHAVWIISAVLAVGLLLASLRGYSIWLRGESPITPGPDPASGFNALSGVISLASALICLGLAFLIFLRKRDEPMALFVSFYVMAYGVIMAGPLENLSPLFPGVLDLATAWVQPILLGAPTVWLMILLPDGRPVPAWNRWVGFLSVASLAFLLFVDDRSVAAANTLPAQLMYGTWLAFYVLAFGAQVYRYRRVSTPAQRAQTRWIVFGLVVWIGLLILQSVPYVYLGSLPPGTAVPGWAAASAVLWWLAISVIPVTLAIAILRYRLYAIAALTAILAGLYAASISLFQRVFIALTGQKSDAAIVLTTLILASAFTSIKARLQAIVDRRFRDVRTPVRRLAEFSKRIDSRIWVIDARLALGKLLEEAVAAFDAVGGEAYWQADGMEQRIAAHGEWNGDTRLNVILAAEGRMVGRIALGPRRNDMAYTPEDAQALSAAAEALARAMPSTAPYS